MKSIKYKPQNVMEILGISREQFRHWRRVLDTRPERPTFGYQMILAYAVLQVLIDSFYLKPHVLKEFDLSELFKWFEMVHNLEERAQTVIEIDKAAKTLRIQHYDYKYRFHSSQQRTEYIFLLDIENQVKERMMN